MSQSWVWALLVGLAVTGCKNRQGGEGGGGAGGGAEGGQGQGGEGAVPASSESLADVFVRGASSTVALGGPLYGGGDTLYQERDTADDTRAHQIVEDAVATNSIVTDGMCVTFDWAGLSATITFTSCVLEATGQPLDGALTFTVTINPTSFALDFAALTLGDNTTDGNVTVSFTGDGMLGRTTDADLTFTTPEGATHFTLADGRLTVAASSITLNGAGTITTGSVDGSYDVASVLWAQGDKCPSGGSVTLDEASSPAVKVTFLPTTPADGNVEYKVGNFPAVVQPLPVCAP